MKRTVLAVILTIVPAVVWAEAKSKPNADEQALIQMENEWAVALAKPDVAMFDRLTAPEWTMVDPAGVVNTKAQVLADFKSGVMKFESYKLDDLKVRVFGDTAIVHGLDTEKSSFKGKDTSGQYRFTDVFVKRDGRWLCVATHISAVAKQ